MTQEEFDILWEQHLELVENVHEVHVALPPLEDMILLETEDRRLAISRASLEVMLGYNVQVHIYIPWEKNQTYYVIKYED